MLTERRVVRGMMDFGDVAVPPRPQYIIMTDRTDGTLWWLTFSLEPSTSDGLGYFAISDVMPDTVDQTVYGPYEGPYISSTTNEQGHPVLRLLIRDGRLGYEQVNEQGVQAISTPRVIARKFHSRAVREIVTPMGWRYTPQVLGWVEL